MRHFNSLGIGKKMSLVAVFPLLFIVILGIVSSVSIEKMVVTQQWVNHTDDVILKITDIEKSLLNLENGQRGYLITAKADFLAPYNQATQQLSVLFSQAKRLTADNPEQQQKLTQIESLVQTWLDQAGKPEIKMRDKVATNTKDSDYLQTVLRKEVGKTILDQIRHETDQLNSQFKKAGNTQGQLLTLLIAKDIVDRETGERGYLLTGVDSFLQPYDEGQNQLTKHIDALNQIIDTAYDREQMTVDINQLKSLAHSWLTEAAIPEIELRQQVNQGSKKFADIEQVLRRAKGKNILDSYQQQLKKINDAFAKSKNQLAQTLTQSIAKAIVDQQAGQRGYLLTGDDSFLAPYEQGKFDLKRHINALTALTSTAYNTQQVRRSLKRIAELAMDWQDKAATPEIAARIEINRHPTTMADVTALIEQGTGKSIMDQLRLELHNIKAEEFRLMALRQSDSLKSAATANSLILIGSLIIIALSLMLAFLIIREVMTQLKNTVESVENIANSNYTQSVSIVSNDEIAAVGLAVNQLLERLKHTAAIAKRISQGEYNIEIEIQGEHDELGKSLQRMTHSLIENQNNLSLKRSELEEQDWIKSHHTEIISNLQGTKNLKSFADLLLSTLVSALDAHIGLFYQVDHDAEQQLILAASYAFQTRKNLSNKFALGEGLVGQCALERKMIMLSNIPDDYIKISSGTGESQPKQIIVFPLEFENNLMGVIEIGCLTEISPKQQSLIELLQLNIGVSINNIYSHNRTEALLQQSQVQAIELQSQQKELQTTNESLEEHTQQLKKSQRELKQQSEELKVSNEELEEKQELLQKQQLVLEEAKHGIEIKASELALASKYKSEFLANMSHELRTPLNSLLILSKSLAENKEGNLSQQQQVDAEVIVDGGNDLLNLINDIMDLSKVEAGMLDVTMASIRLAEIARSLTSLFGRAAQDKGLQFNVTIQPSLEETIYTDGQRLEQILKNFLSNALKFTERGSIEVHIGEPPADIRFHSNKLKLESTISIAVIDTGVGITKEKQLAIFEAFQQEDGSTSRQYGGTGLGLAISRELTFLLGGEIHLVSDKGVGSTFTLYLPKQWNDTCHGPQNDDDVPTSMAKNNIKANHLSAVKTDADTTQQAPHGVTVSNNTWLPDDRREIQLGDNVLLIIEDDPNFAKILQRLGRENKQKTLLTNKGRNGLLLALEFNPNGILLDMELPDITGLAVLEQLRDNGATRNIPVHVLSAGDYKSVSLERGAINFLSKPTTINNIRMALDSINNTVAAHIKNILVVEDDDQHSTAALLKSKDMNVSCAASIEQAYTLLSQSVFDCIVMDLILPDAQGIEVLEKITAHPAVVNIPIVVHTAREITDHEHEFLKKYSSSIVVKGAESTERLLDDVSLFLHRVGKATAIHQPESIKMLHDQNAMLTNRRILLVDDDMRNIYAIKRLLSKIGLIVTPAENGQIAIDKAQTAAPHERYELILMDIMMPIKDGFEAMNEIRRMSEYTDTPIIALTAKAMPEDRQKCLDAGASDYIIKPIDTEKLLSMMRVWLYQQAY